MSGISKKHLNEREFKRIKQVLAAGVSVAMTAKAVDRTYATVQRVSKAKAFEDYRKPKATKMVVTPSTATANQLDILHLVQNINDEIVEIKKSIKWLEENTAVPTRRKLW